MDLAIVLDASGQRLSPCSLEKARHLLAEARATLISEDPFTIQLPYAVARKTQPSAMQGQIEAHGRRLLLHICCGPCSTYPIRHLRDQGFSVTGLWYNPNVHPYSEYERRRECVRTYVEEVNLPVIWSKEYDISAYFDAVAGHEARGERCTLCYRLRLERTAQVARELHFEAFTTTLLISPYQEQAAIRSVGEELADRCGITFHFENLRRGWHERGRVARQHGLYQQRYCGCVYSEWEADVQRALSARSVRWQDKRGSRL